MENTLLLGHVEIRSRLNRNVGQNNNVGKHDYDTSIREFRITERGIEVASTFESAEAVLTDMGDPAETRQMSRSGMQRRGGQV